MGELTLELLRKMGGEATFRKYGREHYQRMAKLSAEKRRANKTKNSLIKEDK